jgi:hypothetical protein
VASVQRVGNSIVGSEELSIQNLLEMLESDDAANVHAAMISEDFSLSQDPKVRADQVVRIARLLNSQEWQARRVAAKLLGRSDDITQAPELIYALTDNDPIVPVLSRHRCKCGAKKVCLRTVEKMVLEHFPRIHVPYQLSSQWKKMSGPFTSYR